MARGVWRARDGGRARLTAVLIAGLLVPAVAAQETRPASSPNSGGAESREWLIAPVVIADCENYLDDNKVDSACRLFLKAVDATAKRSGEARAPRNRDPLRGSDLVLRLSLALEERGDLTNALAVRKAREDVSSWCGNCAGGQAADREVQLARMRIRLGASNEGMTDLWCLVNPSDAPANGRDPNPFGASWERELEYALAGLLTRERGLDARLDRALDKGGPTAACIVKLDEAVAAKDPARLLDAVPRDWYRGFPLDWSATARNAAVRLWAHNLDKLGDAARAELSKRLDAGDQRALQLAPWTSFFDLQNQIRSFPCGGDEALERGRAFALEILTFRRRFAK